MPAVGDARERGLIVIADAKRGDIDISALAYGQAFFGSTPTPFGDVPGLGADALTVNPLLGRDSLAPLVDAARAHGGGLFVLTRPSNPGAADIQDRELASGEAVTAVVVSRPGHVLRSADIIAALKDEIAGFKVPKRVYVVDELPRNAMGKVEKSVLRGRYSET